LGLKMRLRNILVFLFVTLFAASAGGEPYNKTNTFVAGTTITASEVNANFDEIETATDDNGSDIDALQLGSVVMAIATSTGGTLTVNQVHLGTATADYDLPDSCDTVTGNWVTLICRDAEVCSLTVLASEDSINLDGVTLGANDELDSGGVAFDSVTVVCAEANEWFVISEQGTWVDGGVP